MKRNLYIVAIVLSLVTLFTFGSCMLDALGVRDTMEDFVDDLNAGNWGDLYKHTHSNAVMYTASKTSTYWSNEFLEDSYSLTFTDDDSAIVTGDGGTPTYNFTLGDDDGDMKITTITRVGTVDPIFN